MYQKKLESKGLYIVYTKEQNTGRKSIFLTSLVNGKNWTGRDSEADWGTSGIQHARDG